MAFLRKWPVPWGQEQSLIHMSVVKTVTNTAAPALAIWTVPSSGCIHLQHKPGIYMGTGYPNSELHGRMASTLLILKSPESPQI